MTEMEICSRNVPAFSAVAIFLGARFRRRSISRSSHSHVGGGTNAEFWTRSGDAGDPAFMPSSTRGEKEEAYTEAT